ncbi:hypothetical protein V4V48_003037 [Vibrio mimicus]
MAEIDIRYSTFDAIETGIGKLLIFTFSAANYIDLRSHLRISHDMDIEDLSPEEYLRKLCIYVCFPELDVVENVRPDVPVLTAEDCDKLSLGELKLIAEKILNKELEGGFDGVGDPVLRLHSEHSAMTKNSQNFQGISTSFSESVIDQYEKLAKIGSSIGQQLNALEVASNNYSIGETYQNLAINRNVTHAPILSGGMPRLGQAIPDDIIGMYKPIYDDHIATAIKVGRTLPELHKSIWDSITPATGVAHELFEHYDQVKPAKMFDDVELSLTKRYPTLSREHELLPVQESPMRKLVDIGIENNTYMKEQTKFSRLMAEETKKSSDESGKYSKRTFYLTVISVIVAILGLAIPGYSFYVEYANQKDTHQLELQAKDREIEQLKKKLNDNVENNQQSITSNP